MSAPVPLREPACSIVIPTYNGRRELATCLASIARHRPTDRDLEVIVVDDGSRDDTLDWLAQHPLPFQVQVVARPVNGGFCAAANDGIARARAPFIQLLNNDTEVTAGWIAAGLRPFDDPRVASVAPLVLWRSDPCRVDSAGDAWTVFGMPVKRGHGDPIERWADRPVEPVLTASASSAFYRTEALRRVGGFESAYGSYYEDVDLGLRLRWAGYRHLFASACRILHDVSASYDHRDPRLQRRLARNAEYLYWTNAPSRMLALTIGPRLAFLAAQALWRLKQGRLGPFLLGKLDAIGQARAILRRRRTRIDLGQRAVGRPHFPLAWPTGRHRKSLSTAKVTRSDAG